MHTFENDYSEGAAREILDALCNTSPEERRGYGMDSHCANAASLIKKEIKDENVDVHFVPGGTPCNTLACSHGNRKINTFSRLFRLILDTSTFMKPALSNIPATRLSKYQMLTAN